VATPEDRFVANGFFSFFTYNYSKGRNRSRGRRCCPVACCGFLSIVTLVAYSPVNATFVSYSSLFEYRQKMLVEALNPLLLALGFVLHDLFPSPLS
jgi:hypothetical protein